MSIIHDTLTPVKVIFSGDLLTYPTDMQEQDILILSQQVIVSCIQKEFICWRYFREYLWRVIYKYHGNNFNLPQVQKAKGRAPYSIKRGKVYGSKGTRSKLEIHHKIPCSIHKDGYADLHNMIILYPKTHDTVHYLDKQLQKEGFINGYSYY